MPTETISTSIVCDFCGFPLLKPGSICPRCRRYAIGTKAVAQDGEGGGFSWTDMFLGLGFGIMGGFILNDVYARYAPRLRTGR